MKKSLLSSILPLIAVMAEGEQPRKAPKRAKINGVKHNVIQKGMRKFIFEDDIVIWAVNEKNAQRKYDKIKSARHGTV